MASLPPGMDPSKIPIAPPPSPEIKSNFVNPQSKAPTAIGVIVLFTILMFLFVCARMYTKLFVSRSKGWDDYMCLLACACSIAYMGVAIDVFERGYAVHTWNIPVTLITRRLLDEVTVIQAFYGPTILFTKLCLFILYYRLFSPSKIMRYLIYFGVAFNVVFYLIYLFLYAFLCSSKAQSCASELKTLGLATSAINVGDDFYILSIPLAAISNLQLPPKKKLGLLAIFFTGFLACLCSIVSLYFRVVLSREKDDVWNAVPVIVLGTVEFNIGIICACLPTLPALFRRANFSRKTGNNSSYEAKNGTSANARSGAGAVDGGGKRGFGRLGDRESKDSVAGLAAARREGDVEGGDGGYEMGGYQGEEDMRKTEWFRQARM